MEGGRGGGEEGSGEGGSGEEGREGVGRGKREGEGGKEGGGGEGGRGFVCMCVIAVVGTKISNGLGHQQPKKITSNHLFTKTLVVVWLVSYHNRHCLQTSNKSTKVVRVEGTWNVKNPPIRTLAGSVYSTT